MTENRMKEISELLFTIFTSLPSLMAASVKCFLSFSKLAFSWKKHLFCSDNVSFSCRRCDSCRKEFSIDLDWEVIDCWNKKMYLQWSFCTFNCKLKLLFFCSFFSVKICNGLQKKYFFLRICFNRDSKVLIFEKLL